MSPINRGFAEHKYAYQNKCLLKCVLKFKQTVNHSYIFIDSFVLNRI